MIQSLLDGRVFRINILSRILEQSYDLIVILFDSVVEGRQNEALYEFFDLNKGVVDGCKMRHQLLLGVLIRCQQVFR